MDGRTKSDKIKEIYDAAFAKDRWNTALDAVLEGTKARAILLYDTGRNRGIEYSRNAADSEFSMQRHIIADYNTMLSEGRHSNCDAEAFSFVHKRQPFEAVLDEQIWSIDKYFRSRPEIAFNLERVGTFRRFLVNLSEEPLSYSGIIAMYSKKLRGRPPKADVESVRYLAPHVAKTLELNRAIFGLREKYNAVLSVLDMIDVPICIVGQSGNVVLKNKCADELFHAKDGVWLDKSGRLVCRVEDTHASLADAIHRVGQTAAGQNDDRSVELEIRRSSGLPPLFAIASPLRDSDIELERGLKGTLLTIIDGDRPLKSNLELMCSAYGLTGAEARVCPFLARGLSNSQISERLGVGHETIKSQVSSILGKTQSKNRLAFVWRVFQFSPPIL